MNSQKKITDKANPLGLEFQALPSLISKGVSVYKPCYISILIHEVWKNLSCFSNLQQKTTHGL